MIKKRLLYKKKNDNNLSNKHTTTFKVSQLYKPIIVFNISTISFNAPMVSTNGGWYKYALLFE